MTETSVLDRPTRTATDDERRALQAQIRFERTLQRAVVTEQFHPEDTAELRKRAIRIAEERSITRTRAVGVAMNEFRPELAERREARRKVGLIQGLWRLQRSRATRTWVKRWGRCHMRGCRGQLAPHPDPEFALRIRDKENGGTKATDGQVLRCTTCNTSQHYSRLTLPKTAMREMAARDRSG
jgi:hypothetical protein